jgi:hypothetical protein
MRIEEYFDQINTAIANCPRVGPGQMKWDTFGKPDLPTRVARKLA